MRAVGLGPDALEQRPDGEPRVAHDCVIDGRPPSDVAGAAVDLDDLLALRIPVGVGEVGAEHQQQVAAVKRALRRRVADQAALPDRVRVVGLQPRLGLERQHHRRAQPVGELQDLGPGVARAMADEQRDPRCAIDPLGRLRDGAGLRNDGHLGVGDARRRPVHVECADIPGHGEHGDAGGVQRALDRLLDQARQLRWAGDRAAEHRHVAEHRVVVDLLEEVGTQLRERHLTADGQHRRVGLLGVIETVEQVQRARPHRAHAHAQSRAELCLGAGGKRAGLLVAHADPLQAVLLPDGVGDRVQRVADDAPHRPHAEVRDRVDDRLGHRGHQALRMAISWGANESGSARAQSACQDSGGSWSSWPGCSHSYSSA